MRLRSAWNRTLVWLAVMGCCSSAMAATRFGVVPLGTLGGASSYATDIDDNGRVVGFSDTADGKVRGFLYSPGQPLTTLGGAAAGNSYAYRFGALGILGAVADSSVSHTAVQFSEQGAIQRLEVASPFDPEQPESIQMDGRLGSVVTPSGRIFYIIDNALFEMIQGVLTRVQIPLVDDRYGSIHLIDLLPESAALLVYEQGHLSGGAKFVDLESLQKTAVGVWDSWPSCAAGLNNLSFGARIYDRSANDWTDIQLPWSQDLITDTFIHDMEVDSDIMIGAVYLNEQNNYAAKPIIVLPENNQAYEATELLDDAARAQGWVIEWVMGMNAQGQIIAWARQNGGPIQSVIITATAPASPSNLTITKDPVTGANILNWTDNSNDEDSYVLRVRRSILEKSYSTLATLDANETSFTDSQASEGVQYQINGSNWVGFSDAAYVEDETGMTFDIPTNHHYDVISGPEGSLVVNLSWNNNAVNSHGIVIEQRTEAQGPAESSLGAGTVAAFEQLGLLDTDSTQFEFPLLAESATVRIRALLPAGRSAATEDILIANPKPVNLQAISDLGGVSLAWTVASGMENALFTVERREASEPSGVWEDIGQAHDESLSGSFQYRDQTALPAKTYEYKVSANVQGVLGAYEMTQVHVMALQPTYMATVLEDSSVTLSWIFPTWILPQYFHIERRELGGNSGAEWQSLGMAYPAYFGNRVFYTDVSTESCKQYEYRVYADFQGYYSDATAASVEMPCALDPLADADGDGIPNGWEIQYGLDPQVNEAGLDPDGDGLTTLMEYKLGTDPMDEQSGVERVRGEKVVDSSWDAKSSIAVDLNGQVYVWGTCYKGNGTGYPRFTGPNDEPLRVPTAIPAAYLPEPVVEVSAGNGFFVALEADGDVMAWGTNGMGQVGVGLPAEVLVPTKVAGLPPLVRVSAGSQHVLGLDAQGNVWAWGSNSRKECGSQQGSNPRMITGLPPMVALDGGIETSFALDQDGHVWRWGTIWIKNAILASRVEVPHTIDGLDGAVAMAYNRYNGYALKGDGSVWVWGNNSYGQYGNGTVANQYTYTPRQVPSLSEAVSLAAGDCYAMVTRVDGTVWGWGQGSVGQLGQGTTSSSSLPTQMKQVGGSLLSDAYGVFAGFDTSFVLKNDGTVWTCGDDYRHQAGDGGSGSTYISTAKPCVGLDLNGTP